MKKLAIMLVAFAVVVGGVATPALAGPYFSVNGGVVWIEDSDLSFDGYNNVAELSYDTGYSVSAALGNAYGNGVRAELEIPYRTNEFDDVVILGVVSVPVDGDISTWGLMANAYYDFATNAGLTPFVGAGIGFVNVRFDSETSDDDAVFAYQFMAGCGFPLSKDVTFDLQYRFFATQDPEFEARDPDFGKVKLESEYMTHNLMLGLRFNF